jgi:hypothetical protein
VIAPGLINYLKPIEIELENTAAFHRIRQKRKSFQRSPNHIVIFNYFKGERGNI